MQFILLIHRIAGRDGHGRRKVSGTSCPARRQLVGSAGGVATRSSRTYQGHRSDFSNTCPSGGVVTPRRTTYKRPNGPAGGVATVNYKMPTNSAFISTINK